MLRFRSFSWMLLLLLALPVHAPLAQEQEHPQRIHTKQDHPKNGEPVEKKHGGPRPTDEEAVADCQRILGSIVTVDYSRTEGPRLLVRPYVPPSAVTPETLKIGSYNWENVLDYQGQREFDPATGKMVWTADPYEKPAERLAQNIDVERRSNQDLGFAIEIEGMNPITQIIHDYLGDAYIAILVEGNDERGIQVPFLAKLGLPFWYEVLSHRNVLAPAVTPALINPPIRLPLRTDGAVAIQQLKKAGQQATVQPAGGHPEFLFSRDLPVVIVRPAGSAEDAEPILILAGTHFKSQRDRLDDPMSKNFRKLQVIEAIKILLRLQVKYPNTPILMMGDFNADIRTAEEFRSIWENGFRDSFDVAQSVALADRITQIYFPKGLPPVYSQLDGILLNVTAVMADILLAAEIVPYLNPDGSLMPLPKEFKDRLKQGSDHKKIQVILDLAKIMRDYKARTTPAKPLSAIHRDFRHLSARPQTDRRAPVAGAAADIESEILQAA
jgi:hypothetical protein